MTGQRNKEEEPHTAAEIEALRLSFAAKVDEKEFPPAVKYRGNCDSMQNRGNLSMVIGRLSEALRIRWY